jgi:hypothetical protein
MAQGASPATLTVFEGRKRPAGLLRPPAPDEIDNRTAGSRCEILDTSIKKYPAASDAGHTGGYFRLVKTRDQRARANPKIVVRLPDSQRARSMTAICPISCQYLLSVAMIDGTIDFENSRLPAHARPQVLELKRQIVADTELTKRHPRCARPSSRSPPLMAATSISDRSLPARLTIPCPLTRSKKNFIPEPRGAGDSRAHSVVQATRNLENLPEMRYATSEYDSLLVVPLSSAEDWSGVLCRFLRPLSRWPFC